MDPLYVAALSGTLKSNPNPGRLYPSLKISSTLTFSVYVYTLSTTGARVGWVGNNYAKGGNIPYLLDTPQNAFGTSNVLAEGDIILVVSAHSGGFVSVIELADSSQKELVITSNYLSDPNDIGPVPVPTKQVLIPSDSPRVVVGSGQVPTANNVPQNSIVREQYWKLLPDSYSLAPGATKQVSFTLTTGMESTAATSPSTQRRLSSLAE